MNNYFGRATVTAGIVALMCASAAIAQAPASPIGAPSAGAHPRDTVAGHYALPGDRLPPFGVLDMDGKLKPQAPGPLSYDPTKKHSEVPAPSLEIAIEGARAALADCASRQRRGAVTVVDSAGEVRVSMTADSDDGSHVFVAQRKAITALVFKTTSSDARDAVAKDPSLVSKVTPQMFVMFGAIPITSKGQIIGAIGYSGGDDVNCATAGWKAIQARLPQ